MEKIISAVVVTLVAAAAQAQSFTLLKSLGIPNLTNRTGTHPYSHVIQGPDGTLYGTASDGEANVRGTIFNLNSDGTGFTVLKWFTNAAEGTNPQGESDLVGSVLYGRDQLWRQLEQGDRVQSQHGRNRLWAFAQAGLYRR